MFRNVLVRGSQARSCLKRALKTTTVRTLVVECSKKAPLRCLPPLTNHPVLRPVTVTSKRYFADYPPHVKVTLPALSPTMETGTIVSWSKKEGDRLNEGDLLAEIETDKATMGFETPEEGYLAKILVPGGSRDIPIGKLVCIIVEKENDVAAFKDYKDDGKAVAPPKPKPAAGPAPPTPAADHPALSVTPPALSATPPALSVGRERVYASPMAKRLAEQQNIRLQGQGSGMYGSITSADLAKQAPQAPAGKAAPKSAKEEKAKEPLFAPGQMHIDIPVTGVRATIAKRLLASKQQIPHYYVSIDANVDELLKLRARINKQLADKAKDKSKALKLSVNDFIVKASAVALQRVPECNSLWMDSVIRQYKHCDISIAVASDRGLITPIVFEADIKGVMQISKDVKALAKKAREGKLQPHEYQGGTFCVSNLGMFGVDRFCAIINPPQTGILAIGTNSKRLVKDDKAEKGFREAEFLCVTLSADHRVVDGAIAAHWLQAFRECIEDPVTMIL